MNSCANSAQSYTPAGSTSLVRACNTVNCTYAERVWRKVSAVTAQQLVEVCAADKPVGAPVTECKGATATTWGAMAMVPLTQVVQLVEGEPQFPGTFAVTPDNGVTPLSVTITWDLSAFTGGTCSASGSWTGIKALKGTQTVTNLTANASYTFACARPTPGKQQLQWTVPVEKVDGSVLDNLAGFRVVYGKTADALSQVIQVPNPSVVTHTVTGLSAGTWFFAVKAYNTLGMESVLSNIESAAVAAGSETITATRNVVVTQPPPPKPPVLQVIDAQVFNAAPDYSILSFKPSRLYGMTAIGTPCDQTKPVQREYYPVPETAVEWSTSARTKYPIARCAYQ